MRLSTSLCFSTSLLALAAAAIPVNASAQTVDPAPQPDTQVDSPVEPTPTPTDEDEEPSSTNLSAENPAVNEPIIVTGSRIRRPDFDTANPMISIGSDQIEQSGTTNVTDIRRFRDH